MKHKSAKFGTALLIAGTVLFWFREWAWMAAALAAVGVIDIVLVVKVKDTISRWVWGRFRPWVDAGWMVVVVGVTVLVLGPKFGLAVLLGVIVGHLAWQSSEG